MLKKRFILLCLSAAALFFLYGCGAKTAQSLPQLVIGCDEHEPYNYTDEDGEPAGMDVELAKEACRRMGYVPVFRRIDWNERDTLLEKGKIDCLWSCFAMDGQEDRYSWVGPYMHSRQIIAVLKDSPVHSFEDLNGKSIGVRVNSKAEEILLNDTDVNVPHAGMIYSLNTAEELATALRNGNVDAIAGYAATAREILQNDGIEFRFLNENLNRASLGVAFSRNENSEQQRKLAETLNEMLKDGTVKRILDGYEVETDKALEGLGNE